MIARQDVLDGFSAAHHLVETGDADDGLMELDLLRLETAAAVPEERITELVPERGKRHDELRQAPIRLAATRRGRAFGSAAVGVVFHDANDPVISSAYPYGFSERG